MSSLDQRVILVDEHDKELGVKDKLAVHQQGDLHRCFSIFIFNKSGKMLLQKRAADKYHSGGLWSNACCGHPYPGTTTQAAAEERLKYEMGLDCSLREAFSFLYQTKLENGFVEYEFDHVFIGSADSDPRPNQAEVQDWRWINMASLEAELKDKPETFTYWFKICYQQASTANDSTR